MFALVCEGEVFNSHCLSALEHSFISNEPNKVTNHITISV